MTPEEIYREGNRLAQNGVDMANKAILKANQELVKDLNPIETITIKGPKKF